MAFLFILHVAGSAQITLSRTDANDQNFKELVVQLDEELRVFNGDSHSFRSQFNTLSNIKHAVVAYTDGVASGIGAIREYSPGVMEVKRMYVPKSMRGKGSAAAVLSELEQWAVELGYHECVLETATYLPAAVKLYERNGYQRIPNYGQYENIATSVCMKKKLKI